MRPGMIRRIALFALAGLLAFISAPLPALSVPPVTGDPGTEERVPLGAVPPKEGPDGMDGRLMRVAAAARDQGTEQAAFLAKETGLHTDEGMIQVVIEATPEGIVLAEQAIVDHGGVVEIRYGHLVQSRVPPAGLDALTQLPGVARVRAPQYGQSLGVTTEGAAGMGVAQWHDFGFRGAGARVAIADLGFDSYTSLIGSELTGRIIARSFRQDGDITGGGDPHGTAAAEVVFDLAPEATFYLVNFSTEVELGAAVEWLISEGVHVISSSVGWPGTGFADGRGPVNDIVRRADQAGVLWVQGAGNFGQSHWSGQFTDPEGNGFHNFGPTDEGNTITLRRLRPGAEQIFRVEIFLTWDDWESFSQDYDLFLFRGETVVAQSTAFQNGRFPPVEHIVYTTAGSGEYWIAVQRFRTTRRARLDLVVTIDYGMEYRVPQESLVIPADSPFALSVGAVAPGTLDVRPYSSQGPTKDGRIKPDLVAGDQVSTHTYGPGGFSGTSASAPHVAGAALLVKGARLDLSPASLRALFMSRASGPGQARRNNQVGAGYVALGEVLGRYFLPLSVRSSPLPPPIPRDFSNGSD